MTEEWGDIGGFEGVYQVSTIGRVRRIAPSKRVKELPFVMKTTVGRNGYEYVRLCLDGKYFTKTVHRLVAECFVNGSSYGDEVNHIDGNRSNNTVSNLEWVSGSQNRLHSARTLYSHPNRRTYVVTTPDGFVIEVMNLTEFCEEHNITRSGMGDVLGGRQGNHRGYTVKYKET